MPHGYFFMQGLLFTGVHIVVVVGGLYLLYSISKSLKRIADSLEKKSD